MRFNLGTAFAVLAIVARVSAQDDDDDSESEGVTCFGVNGQGYPNNTRCAGSGTCCGMEAQCMPNRLCKNPGQEENMFVRGPCAFDPYDDTRCASICVYDENGAGASFFFPRVEVCDDGSFCCSNIANCCERGRGTFMDTRGNIISGPSSESSASSAESSTSTSSSASESTPSPSPTADPSGEPSSPTNDASTEGEGGDGDGDGGSSNALPIGLGVAIPVVVILAGIGLWFYLRRRRNARQNPTPPGGPMPADTKEVPWKPAHGVPQTQVELDTRPHMVYEMDDGQPHTSTSPYSSTPYSASPRGHHAQELAGR